MQKTKSKIKDKAVAAKKAIVDAKENLNAEKLAKKAESSIEGTLETFPEVLEHVIDMAAEILGTYENSKKKALVAALSTVKILRSRMKTNPWLTLSSATVVGFVSGYLSAHKESVGTKVKTELKH